MPQDEILNFLELRVNDSGNKYFEVQLFTSKDFCLPPLTLSTTFPWLGEMKVRSRFIIEKEEVAFLGRGLGK